MDVDHREFTAMYDIDGWRLSISHGVCSPEAGVEAVVHDVAGSVLDALQGVLRCSLRSARPLYAWQP